MVDQAPAWWMRGSDRSRRRHWPKSVVVTVSLSQWTPPMVRLVTSWRIWAAGSQPSGSGQAFDWQK
jgi:hypothetical protein